MQLNENVIVMKKTATLKYNMYVFSSNLHGWLIEITDLNRDLNQLIFS